MLQLLPFLAWLTTRLPPTSTLDLGGNSDQGQDAKRAGEVNRGREDGEGSERSASALPCHGPSPRCSEREDSCHSGGVCSHPIYYFY